MSTLLVDLEDGILQLTLNRPEKLNAINDEMYGELITQLKLAEVNDSVRVIIIAGANGTFTVGNDLTDFIGNEHNLANYPGIEFLHLLATYPKPLIAAIEGTAIGIGVTMLMHMDFVYACSAAVFQMPFVDLGVCIEGGSSLMLVKKAGILRATKLALLGEQFRVKEARRCGIITDIVPPGYYVKDYAVSKAKKLAAKPVQALLETKKLLRSDTNSIVEQIDKEIKVFKKLLATDEAQTRMKAVMKKV